MKTAQVQCPQCARQLILKLQQRFDSSDRDQYIANILDREYEPEMRYFFCPCGMHLEAVKLIGGRYKAARALKSDNPDYEFGGLITIEEAETEK
jgi:hypothetical protein